MLQFVAAIVGKRCLQSFGPVNPILRILKRVLQQSHLKVSLVLGNSELDAVRSCPYRTMAQCLAQPSAFGIQCMWTSAFPGAFAESSFTG